MRKGKLFHKGVDIISFCHICLQELTSGRCIIKKVSHKKSSSVRSSQFFQGTLYSPFYNITGTTDCRRCLGDQFHLGNCCNTGKCLTSESKGCNMLQIFYFLDLTCSMTQKGQRNLICFHTSPIVCNTDQFFSSVCDLHSHSSSTCIDCIFYQLFYYRRGTFHHFPCCNLINGILIQNCDFSQNNLLPVCR